MTAPVSCCLIVKNDISTLEVCLKSIRPHVAEIVIVDTGSQDETLEIARKYADKIEIYTACNGPDGLINSFSEARNHSFSLATQPWVMWADGDDEVFGLENLSQIISQYTEAASASPVSIMFPYEYAHDDVGNPTLVHYRERLISNRQNFEWVGDVHEVLCSKHGSISPKSDLVKYVHRRQFSNKKTESGRNLRILRRTYQKLGDTDARVLYYLGMECRNNGFHDESIKHLTKHIEISGWPDEQYMSCLLIVEIHKSKGDYEKAIEWCQRAILIREDWGEAYFEMAKCFYFLAQAGKETRRNWERCVHFAQRGLSFPPTNTVLFINPLERQFEIHKYLNVALNALGDVRGALKSVENALSVKHDESMESNRNLYGSFLSHQKFSEDLNDLVRYKKISQPVRDQINSIVSGDIVKSEHSDIVGYQLPERQSLDSYPEHVPQGALLSMFQSFWKTLLLHDELFAAEHLMKAVPWAIRDTPEIAGMRAKTDSILAPHHDLDLFAHHYSHSESGPVVTETIPMPNPVPAGHDHLPRWEWLLEVAAEQELVLGRKLDILDIGSADGWITNRITQTGHKAWGIDTRVASVDLARAKAAQFSTGAVHEVHDFMSSAHVVPEHFPDSYDIVVLYEVYEHLHDPVEAFKRIRSVLKPGGQLLISTPRGSWGQGVTRPGHYLWNDESFREHIRAAIPSDLERDYAAAGLFGFSSRVVDHVSGYVPGQAALLARGGISLQIEQTRAPLDIVLYVGWNSEPWNPETAAKTGIGGSETAAMEMSKRLVALGNKVRLYGECAGLEGTFSGVEYIHYSKFSNISCDALIVSRRPQALDAPGLSRKATFCWVHDIHCGSDLTHERALRIDKFLTLSQWHKKFFSSQYDFLHPSQMAVTRNGIDLDRFNLAVSRNPHKAVYSSSPDRGMEVAIRSWHLIRQRIPDAELHIYYGFENWEASAKHDQGQKDLIARLKKLLSDNDNNGVVYHGRVDQKTLAREYLSGGVWAYSTWFSETSCQLAGSLIFTKNGMKPIEQIEVGDLVLTHKGRFRRVTQLIQKEYDGNLYLIKTKKNCNPVTITEEHPLYRATFHKNELSRGKRVYGLHNKKLEWVTPDKLITDRDYLVSPKMQFGDLRYIQLSDYVDMPVHNGMICSNHNNLIYASVPNRIKLTSQFMRILGLFAAEGSVSKTKDSKRNKHYGYSRITFAFHKKEVNLINEITEFFGKGSVRSNSENGVSVNIYSAPWAYFFKKLIGTGRAKKIPSFVWDCSFSLQNAFISGITDGDGWIGTKIQGNGNKPYTYRHYTSVSPSLAYGVSQLLSNCGIYPSITYSPSRDNYDLHWGIDQSNKNNHQSHRVIDEGFATRIKSIDIQKYRGLVYNFEVEEDRSYVTDRTIVHNCISAMEAHAAGIRMVTSPIAALNETVGNRGVMIPGDWLSDEYQRRFVDEVVSAMTRSDDSDRNVLQAYARDNFSWDGVAREWDKMIRKVIDDVSENIIIPYKGAM